jgi:hypothetical protein
MMPMTKKTTAAGSTQRAKPARRPRRKKETRVILFPTEPSTIGDEKIRRAVEAVIAQRKSGR